MEKAREALEQEADIIKLIKSRRFVHMALKYLLDPAIRIELKSRSHLKEIKTEQADSPLAHEGGGVTENKSRAYDVSCDMSEAPEDKNSEIAADL